MTCFSLDRERLCSTIAVFCPLDYPSSVSTETRSCPVWAFVLFPCHIEVNATVGPLSLSSSEWRREEDRHCLRTFRLLSCDYYKEYRGYTFRKICPQDSTRGRDRRAIRPPRLGSRCDRLHIRPELTAAQRSSCQKSGTAIFGSPETEVAYPDQIADNCVSSASRTHCDCIPVYASSLPGARCRSSSAPSCPS
jgi:hypothetical protein